MALGRSNSLSINTGATNTLFGNTNTSNPTNANNTNTSGLFGNANTAAQQPATESIFGNKSTTQQAPTASNLFGTGNVQQQQPAPVSNIFGGQTAQQQQQQQQQPPPPPAASSIFGQAAPTGGLFAQSTNQTNTNSLFGSTARPQTVPVQTTAPSLLGATIRAQQNQPAPFGRLSMGQGNTAGVSVGAAKIDFEGLRGTTRFDDCIDPIREALEGIDKMIQNQESWARQIEAMVAKHDQSISSLGPDVELVKDKAESTEQALAIDAGGVDGQREVAKKDRVNFARCERIITNLALPRQYHTNYAVMTEAGPMPMPTFSYRGPTATARTVGINGPEGPPVIRDEAGVRNLAPGTPLGGDTDLIGNYLAPLAAEISQTMTHYADNLTEIENHLRVIEASAVSRAQHLAQRRAGVTNGAAGVSDGDDTVRELADTLRGFEHSILDTAGVVGECREGVNELLLGRLGNGYAMH